MRFSSLLNSCSRSVARFAFGATVAMVIGSPVDAAPPLDESLLKIEQPVLMYAELKTSPTLAGLGYVTAYDGRPGLPQMVATANRIAHATFNEQRFAQALRPALRGVPQDADTPDLTGVAARLMAVEAKLSKASLLELEKLAEKVRTRPDMPTLIAISDVMAAPELAVQQNVVNQSMNWLIRVQYFHDLGELRALDRVQLEAGVKHIIQEIKTRPAAQDDRTFSREEARRKMRLDRQFVLGLLPPADVRALAAFYASETGRAKVRAIVDVFKAQRDVDNFNALMAVLEAVRRSPA